jgi:sphingolipid 8-(E)-desaturase
MQVSHHLFPRIPRKNLRKLNLLIKDWAKTENLPFYELEWVEGNKEVLSVLEEVSKQVKVLGMVAEGMAKGEVEH